MNILQEYFVDITTMWKQESVISHFRVLWKAVLRKLEMTRRVISSFQYYLASGITM